MAFDKKQFDLEMAQVRKQELDFLTEYLGRYISFNDNLRQHSIDGRLNEEQIAEIKAMDIPQEGRDIREVADELVEKILERSALLQHPRFLSFVNSAVSPYSLAAAILTDIYNPHGGSYMLAPAACLVEEKLIKWMASRASYPTDKVGGLFVSGGSVANMSALIAARNDRLKDTEYPIGVAYLSDQTHSSVAKGLRLIGFRQDQIVKIPTKEFMMRTDLLEEAIKRDLSEGKKPFIVVGTIGTTNTGSIDPLPEIGRIAQKYGLWFHVDGAYGASILISDIYRNLAKGIELTDSFSWDTHKWAMQTYSCSTVIVKDKNTLLNAFSEHPEYLEDVRSAEHNDPWDLGIEMTRPHRSLKFWFTLQAMGTDKLADVIDYSFFNARLAQKELSSLPNWEITSKPMCGTLTFRYVPEGLSPRELDELNGAISRQILDEGFAYVVTTVIEGKRVLRLCLINGNTDSDDVLAVVERLDQIARGLAG